MTADPELLELDMIYSDVHCYGQGHRCSVIWDMDSAEPKWVRSAFFPEFNLLQMKAASIDAGKIFSMKFLSIATAGEIIPGLASFAEKYREWIDGLGDKASAAGDSFKEIADNNILKCRDAYDRILLAIQLLYESSKSDNKAFRAFQLANEAMLMQRRQSILKNKGQYDPEKITWYPFQLAFILHELSSFIEPSGHPGQA